LFPSLVSSTQTPLQSVLVPQLEPVLVVLVVAAPVVPEAEILPDWLVLAPEIPPPEFADADEPELDEPAPTVLVPTPPVAPELGDPPEVPEPEILAAPVGDTDDPELVADREVAALDAVEDADELRSKGAPAMNVEKWVV
jgi:hypothetical protein